MLNCHVSVHLIYEINFTFQFKLVRENLSETRFREWHEIV